jgi:hypothetical protein
MATNSEIYEAILRDCRTVQLREPWHHVDCQVLGSAFDDPDAALNNLRGRFPNEDLCDAGIALQDGNGQFVLHPALARRGAKVFPLYERAREPVADLIVSGRSLSGQLPLLGALRDYRTQRFLRRGSFQPLCVVGSMPDLVALSHAGLPAAPGTGLASVRDRDLNLLCDALRFESPHRRYGNQPPIELVLVDFNLSRLLATPRPAIETIRRHLCRLADDMQIDTSGARSWAPSEPDLARIRFLLTTRDRTDLEAALRSSMTKNAPRIRTAAAERRSAYHEARTAFLRSLDSRAGREHVCELDEAMRQAYDAGPGAELLRWADEAQNPAERALRRGFAAIVRDSEFQSARFQQKQARFDGRATLDHTEREQLLKLHRELRATAREVL